MLSSSRGPRAALALLCWLAVALSGAAPRPALAQSPGADLLPVTEAYKLSANAATPGVLKLHWTLAPDYYLYRGRMKFTAGPGITLGTARLPDGEKHRDPYLGEVETYHRAIDASLPYTVAAGTTRLVVEVQYQGCHEVDPKICYPPHTEKLDLPLANSAAASVAATGPDALGQALGKLGSQAGATSTPGTTAPLPPEQAFRFDALATAPSRLLLRWVMPPGYYLYRDSTTLSLVDAAGLTLAPQWPAGTPHDDAHFGHTQVYFNELDLPVTLTGDPGKRRNLTVRARFQGCQQGGLCYPPMTREVRVDLGAAPGPNAPAITAAESTGATTPLWLALLLALAGGLVLNLMPCVLPVLSIKAVGVLESGESPRARRRHALAYSAGVLVSFAVLGGLVVGLRSAGHAFGWGTQLQQPLLVGVLALVMLTVGLSMSGVVQLGASLGNTGAALAGRGGAAGDFFTGVLAVVVASPCTAPFMGSALAYAFAAPSAVALAVFLALGLGLALPFLAIGFVPALARMLPRPGAWMDTLKQVLAFPMYLSAAWLAWVLANQRGPDAIGLLLVAAVLLAMTLWWFERSRYRSAPLRALTVLLAALTVLPLYLLARVPRPATQTEQAAGTVAYSPERLAALRQAGTPVFVDMTADWCVTCKANEHAVLDTDAFHQLLARTSAVYMKGDWTNEDPAISAFLASYHSPGVPLYVVFPAHGGEGKALPSVLTDALVQRALTDAAAP